MCLNNFRLCRRYYQEFWGGRSPLTTKSEFSSDLCSSQSYFWLVWHTSSTIKKFSNALISKKSNSTRETDWWRSIMLKEWSSYADILVQLSKAAWLTLALPRTNAKMEVYAWNGWTESGSIWPLHKLTYIIILFAGCIWRTTICTAASDVTTWSGYPCPSTWNPRIVMT